MCNGCGSAGGGGVNILKTHYGAYQHGSLDYSYHQRVRLLRISQAKGQTHLQHFKCLRHKNALSTVKYVNIALIKGLWNRKMPRKGYDPEPVLIGEWGRGRKRRWWRECWGLSCGGGVGGEWRSDSYHRRFSCLRRTFTCWPPPPALQRSDSNE